ncbi:hypothetical protein BN440_1850 [Erwinia amylovora MR1]|nr:hypothetical protein BN440_1850 [Erwinia amylovora MR1]
MVIYPYQCRQDSATVEVIHSIHRKRGLPRYLSAKKSSLAKFSRHERGHIAEKHKFS